jgi:hypothetical protein
MPRSERAVFRGKSALPLILLIGGLLFLAGWLALSIIALPNPPKNKLSWGEWALIAALLGGGLGGFGAALILFAAPYLGLRVEVDGDGITVRRWYGTSELAWDDLREFWWNADGSFVQAGYTATSIHTLVGRDGRRIRLRSEMMENGAALGPAIEEHVARALTPGLEQALGGGRDVAFGPLTLTADGIVHAGKTLPWKDVARIELLAGGSVAVYQKDGWQVWGRARMSRVPNLAVLFALVGKRLVREGVAQAETEAPEEEEKAPSARWDEDEIAAADLDELGKPIHACEPTAEAKQAFGGAVVCFVLAGLIGIGVSYAVFIAKAFQSPTLPPHIVLILAGVFVGGLVIGGFSLLRMAKQGGYEVRVYEHGFVRLQGGRAWVCPWGRVRRVWQEFVTVMQGGQLAGTTHRITVERDDREQVKVASGEVKQALRFGEELVKRTRDRLLCEALSALRAGEAIDFGNVQLAAKGVSVRGEEVLPWSRFGGARVDEGVLYLSAAPKGTVASCFTKEVANLDVLVAVLERVAKAGAKGPRTFG